MWTETENNNTLEIDENNYVSFLKPYSDLSLFSSDDKSIGETALCTYVPWRCLILNGDFRKEYEELVAQGYEACYNFFSKKAEFGSSWSDE